jgi:hypothetical protein
VERQCLLHRGTIRHGNVDLQCAYALSADQFLFSGHGRHSLGIQWNLSGNGELQYVGIVLRTVQHGDIHQRRQPHLRFIHRHWWRHPGTLQSLPTEMVGLLSLHELKLHDRVSPVFSAK